jgi:hypothetical protein
MIAFVSVMMECAGIQNVVESDRLGHILMVGRGIFSIERFSLGESKG